MKMVVAAVLAAMFSTAVAASSEETPDVRGEVRKATGNFRDYTCITQVVKKNDSVLKKMDKKYVRQHEIEKAKTHFKLPDCLRMEGKVGLVNVQMIMNGNSRIFRVPALRMTKKHDISREPYKKQTALDLGLLCESAWQDFDVKYIGSENQNSGPAYILDFTRKWENPKTYRTWVDKKTMRILQIEKRDSQGKIQAIFKFPKAKLLDGVIWAPTRMELYSPGRELAAVTEMHEMKANTGLSSKLFE